MKKFFSSENASKKALFTPDMFTQLPFKELGETNDPAWPCGPAKYEKGVPSPGGVMYLW